MKRRFKALQRVQQVQKQLSDLAAWRLNALESELAAQRQRRDSLAEAERHGPFSHGALAELVARRRRSIEREIAKLEQTRNSRELEAREQGGRLKVAERLLQRADQSLLSHTERTQLAEIIDRAIKSGNFS